MENSSKALVIAAGILIAVLLLSLFVYLYISMNNFSNTYNENISSQKLQAFNAQFEVYNGRTDLTIQDVVSVASLAKEINTKNQDEKILVNTNITNLNENMDNNEKFTSLTDYANYVFKCTEITYSENTSKVNSITFNGTEK